MADINPSALANLAKKHLGLSSFIPDERVPRFYLEELRRHMSLYPLEDNFSVTLEPKFGFGTVTCHKEGCNKVIPLNRRVNVADGGKIHGLGSLSAYRSHLQSHNRKKSIAVTESTRKSSNKVEREIASSMALHVNVAVADRATASNPFRIKSEASEPTIPRKRLSDIAFGSTEVEQDQNSIPQVKSLSKKVKVEMAIPKTPLAQVTNITSSSNDESHTLDVINVAIARQQRLLDRIGGKRAQSREDRKNAEKYNREIARLDALKHEHTASKPLSLNVKNERVVKQENEDPKSSAIMATSDNPLVDRKPQPFPLAMELDYKPHIKREEPSGSSSTIPQSAPIKAAPLTPPQLQPPLPASPLTIQPIASGSKSSKHEPYDHEPMDVGSDGYDSDFHGYEGMPAVADEVIDKIGIRVPPPILGDAHDDNGDYYGRGRDLFVGPRAQADDIDKFLVEAGNAESFDGNVSVDKALKFLGLQTHQEHLPGMDIPLMTHQILGVAWMVEKELGSFKGGCLADEMGLGKTIQMMSLIVKNQSTDPLCKTTLILAPLALLDQWKMEIETKTNCGLKCLIYHGNSKTSRKTELLKHDVVLTTFMTMAREWPDYESEMKKKAKAKKKGDDFIVSESDDEDMKSSHYRAKKRKQRAGLLFQIDWYRIVLDEGQNIRNRRTRVSRACIDLRSIYRWCLTGTPIINSLSDVYGYLRFLKVRPWYDWAEFHPHVGLLEKKNPGLAVARLQAIMATFLLRRKKDTELDGRRLIELPEKKIDLIKLEFSEEEREIYKMVEARSQAKFNRYLRAGTVLKNYHQVLVLLLRLRQICSHPSLIQEDGVAYVNPDELFEDIKPEFATELTRARRLVSAEFVTKLKEKFKNEALDRMEAEKLSADATVEEDDCPVCFDAMTDPVITACAHIFCRECIEDTLNQAPAGDEAGNGDPNARPCPVCRGNISREKLFSRSAFEPSDKDLNPEAEDDAVDEDDEDIPVTRARKGKGKAKKGKNPSWARRSFIVSDDEMGDEAATGSEDDYSEDDDDDDDISDFIVHSDEDEEEKDARRALKKRMGKKRMNVILDSDDELEAPEVKEVVFGVRKKVRLSEEAIKLLPRFLPSTKMKYMMDQLEQLVKTRPDEKTLIVSQWTGCLSLISDYLTEKEIVHVKYQGDMNRVKRDQAVRVFMSREKARVMLMSLKCGGVGLNLTRANNVISLDLGWSQAIESQAFDRVHRLGQTRDVHVQRVVIADSVEDRILTMQERKQTLADGSLGEGSGKKIGKLTVEQLANLFGLDRRGRVLD
ncbi:hypothetical protein BYT27DRAFT_7243611 [Phlegmacium glaucopus]|nr:hypothetical protein BYT27DRAFT_7243611 [Phlegmacium glaucopus]